MNSWYRFETGNENRKDTVVKHVRRSGLRFEVEDASKRMRCDWWVIKLWLSDDQLKELNAWLLAH